MIYATVKSFFLTGQPGCVARIRRGKRPRSKRRGAGAEVARAAGPDAGRFKARTVIEPPAKIPAETSAVVRQTDPVFLA